MDDQRDHRLPSLTTSPFCQFDSKVHYASAGNTIRRLSDSSLRTSSVPYNDACKISMKADKRWCSGFPPVLYCYVYLCITIECNFNVSLFRHGFMVHPNYYCY